MSPKVLSCTSFQSIEEVMQCLNRRANARWTGQVESGRPGALEASVDEAVKRVPRILNLVHIDSSFSKKCPGADGPAFNPRCLHWIKPADVRCWECQKRLDGQMDQGRPHIRMFTSSRRLCTLKTNCGGLMEAYLKTTWPGGSTVPNRELWWKCMRCGATRQAGTTVAKTQSDVDYACDGKNPRLTCQCAKCCFFFQDQNNATQACSVFLSEAREQSEHIRNILKSEELK